MIKNLNYLSITLLKTLLVFSFATSYGQIEVTECVVENFNIYAITSIEFTSEGVGWAVGQKGAIYKYENNKWEKRRSPTKRNLNKVYFKNKDNGWIIGTNNTILKYSNGTWEKIKSPDPSQNNYHDIDFNNEGIGYIVGSNGVLLKYENNKWKNYKVLNLIPKKNEHLQTIKFNTPNHVIIGGTNTLFEIKDNILKKIDKKNIVGLNYDTGGYFYINTIQLIEDNLGYLIGTDLIKFHNSAFEIIGKLPSTQPFNATIVNKEIWSVSSYQIYQIIDGKVNVIQPNIRTTFRDIAFSDSDTGWVVGTKDNEYGVICKLKRITHSSNKR